MNDMSDLFDKLNVLVQSRLPKLRSPSRRDRSPSPGRKADRDVARLRARIESALADDDRAQAEIAELAHQIANWDAQADAALAAGQDAAARHAIRQMQRLEQRRTIAEADLGAHRRATAELIQQVNAFEAALSEARRQPIDTGSAKPPLPERLAALLEPPPRRAASAGSATPAPLDERSVEDDLVRRRARLSQ